jgi:thiamine-phosphate pyrophosphorylase
MSLSIPAPCLCLVTDRSVGIGQDLISRVADAVDGGVDMVQLREKDLFGGRLLELAISLKEAIGDSALLIINERPDVAIACAASGVQLGEDAIPVAAARYILGPGSLIGQSVHSEESAARASSGGADFLVVGTMYSTSTHIEAAPSGPALIRSIARNCSIPLLGIGGINTENLGAVLRAGANGVAVITGILGFRHPGKAARQLKQSMLAVWSSSDEFTGRSKV